MINQLTEQRRLLLIADCEYSIKTLQKKLGRKGNSAMRIELLQSQLERQQIALASLEAEPPVPALRLPSEKTPFNLQQERKKHGQSMSIGDAVVASRWWNTCLAEVQRLNADAPVVKPVKIPDLPADCDRTEAHYKYQEAIRAAGAQVEGD
ncbi:hypothetical protein [Erwinia sp. 9145]|uniref:hypothetical protein n=1 Tax=Erwinia sp. 9145 TaxID=1500895 RepID=UPI0005531A52|nr:hypothetical protein [Erwinia sp. 9145]